MMHYPVLLKESIDLLNIKPDGIYIDGTFGRGGHSQLILNKLNSQGRLLAFDKDIEAVNYAKEQFDKEPRFSIFHDNFANIDRQLASANIDKVDGILLDLGVSSPQLDTAQRGFSFKFAADLDMRMDTTKGITAGEWLNQAPEEQIAQVLFDYGEEKQARKIAGAIVQKRLIKPITTTQELAMIIVEIIPFNSNKIHPATRSFQAIRIFINQELDDLEVSLRLLPKRLKSKGRLVIISFHSLEDRLVKTHFNKLTKVEQVPRWVTMVNQQLPEFNLIAKKSRASLLEVQLNPRSRSAIMRALERI